MKFWSKEDRFFKFVLQWGHDLHAKVSRNFGAMQWKHSHYRRQRLSCSIDIFCVAHKIPVDQEELIHTEAQVDRLWWSYTLTISSKAINEVWSNGKYASDMMYSLYLLKQDVSWYSNISTVKMQTTRALHIDWYCIDSRCIRRRWSKLSFGYSHDCINLNLVKSVALQDAWLVIPEDIKIAESVNSSINLNYWAESNGISIRGICKSCWKSAIISRYIE